MQGTDVIERPGPADIELCHYHGKLRGIRTSWAAVSTCDGVLSGAFYDGQELHYLEGGGVNGTTTVHYRQSDMEASDAPSHVRARRDILRNIQNEKNEINSRGNKFLKGKGPTPNKMAMKPSVKGPWNANWRSR